MVFVPGRTVGSFGRALDRTFPKRADHVIAPHEQLATYLVQQGCDRARISIVPPWVDVNAFEAPAEPEMTSLVLYTGNLDAYQDQFCQKQGIKERLPVYFITEMVGLAMGLSVEELQIDKHFVESAELLKELNII